MGDLVLHPAILAAAQALDPWAWERSLDDDLLDQDEKALYRQRSIKHAMQEVNR